MGAIVMVSCKSCGAQWSCRTGCGMWHGDLDKVAPLFPKDTENAIRKWAAGSECPVFDFGFHLALCEGCGGVVSVPVLSFPECNARYVGACPNCEGEARLIEDLQRACCPVCGKKELNALETGRWD